MQKLKNLLNSKLKTKSYTLIEIIVYLVDIHPDLTVIAIIATNFINISIFHQAIEKTYETLRFCVVYGNSNFCQKVQ